MPGHPVVTQRPAAASGKGLQTRASRFLPFAEEADSEHMPPRSSNYLAARPCGPGLRLHLHVHEPAGRDPLPAFVLVTWVEDPPPFPLLPSSLLFCLPVSLSAPVSPCSSLRFPHRQLRLLPALSSVSSASSVLPLVLLPLLFLSFPDLVLSPPILVSPHSLPLSIQIRAIVGRDLEETIFSLTSTYLET